MADASGVGGRKRRRYGNVSKRAQRDIFEYRPSRLYAWALRLGEPGSRRIYGDGTLRDC